MLLLLSVVISVDISRLDDPAWGMRDDAETRLKCMGPLAWPHLLSTRESESPETRNRVARLLLPYRDWRDEERAKDVLSRPWPLVGQEAIQFFGDEQLRVRVHRLAVARGCPEGFAKLLLPENESWCFWNQFSALAMCLCAVEGCRSHLGVRAGWPFP